MKGNPAILLCMSLQILHENRLSIALESNQDAECTGQPWFPYLSPHPIIKMISSMFVFLAAHTAPGLE